MGRVQFKVTKSRVAEAAVAPAFGEACWMFWGLQNRVSVFSAALKTSPQALPWLQRAR